MKRLNPETNKPFKQGDLDDLGNVFRCYDAHKKLDGFLCEKWVTPDKLKEIKDRVKNNAATRRLTLDGHITSLLHAAKGRAKKSGTPFNLELDDIKSIFTDRCPVFGIKLAWCTKNGHQQQDSPSLDRIDPEKGYVPGNVQWISMRANAMKHSANFEQLHQFADWIKKTIPLE
jgi:hypothetical protein